MSDPPQQVDWPLEDYPYFRKCGEVTISPDMQYFGMNCEFCPGICVQFEFFVQHMREAHAEDISSLYSATTATTTEAASAAAAVDVTVVDVEGDSVGEEEEEAAMLTQLTVTTAADTSCSVDSDNPKQFINWNEATTSGVVQVELAMDMDMGVGMALQPEVEEAHEEAVDLVYIVESTQQGEMVQEEEETTVDPFETFKLGIASADWRDRPAKVKTSDVASKRGTITTRSKTQSTLAKSTTKLHVAKSPTMSEVEHSKEVIDYLLEAYKHNEKLWNPNHPNYKYNANRKIFNELTEPLLRDMNYTLSGMEIFAIIKGLRSRYCRELSKLKLRKGKYKTRFKYFEKMEFLRNIIESKRAEKEAKNRNEVDEIEKHIETHSDPTKCVQSREVLSYLLAAYKRQESLWNSEHADHFQCNKSELLNEIAAQLLDDMDIAMTGIECSAEIVKLRTRYSKELHLLIKHKGLYVPKLWCFEQMEFLRGVFETQILKRLNKRKGIVASKPKTQFLKSDPIAFKNLQQQLAFIEIYRNYAALWDVDHPDYRSATYRNKELDAMLEEINLSLDVNSTLDQLQKTLFQLRKDFSAEKMKILSDNNSKTATSLAPSTPSEIYSKMAEFLESNLGPFRCNVCKEVIRTSDQYKIHTSSHDGRQPFICTLCGKGFQMPGNLTVHIRRHKRDFPYGCEVCDKRFATSTEVSIHRRTHTGERPYICDLCGKSFKTWSFFDIHRRTHLKQSNFLCPICDKEFYERNRYTDHMNGHLNIRKHICNECGKGFTTYGNLKKHHELHLPVKKYKCIDCGKRFAQFASLRWHRRKAHAQIQNEQ